MINRRNFFGAGAVSLVAVGSKAVLGRDVTAKPQLTMDITPQNAIYYAENIVKAPCPELEEVIAQNGIYAYHYANYILNKPFLLGEAAISKIATSSYWYAANVLDGPFPLGEAVIATDEQYARWYANDVLNGIFVLDFKVIYSEETGFKGNRIQ